MEAIQTTVFWTEYLSSKAPTVTSKKHTVMYVEK